LEKNVNLAHYNKNGYTPKVSVIRRLCWYLVNAIFFNNAFFPFSSLKVLMLRIFGATIGNKVTIKPSVNIKYPWFLKAGNNVWIGEEVWIDNLQMVNIGNNVCISQSAMLLTGNHDYKKSTFDLMVGEIILEDGVWIGARSIVGPGIVCKSHSVLSVNSVASADLESYKIYRGNPAVVVRDRVIGK
jgi:putative colanic acid biosynthesis acetyltransferase WcaF